MAAFDRVKSGITGIDQALDNIRMGDNVVWQLTRLEDFNYVVRPFVRQALEDGRDLVYIRFATHDELVESHPDITRYELNPHEGFEPFTVKVRQIITEHGRDAFYVFDCLSELQVAWSADLMMGNFFRVTCPYLFILDTVAYFPIIRGSHSLSAVGKVRDTTQLFIDVFSDGTEMFYGALLEDASKTPVYQPEILTSALLPGAADVTADILGEIDDSDLEGIVTVFETREANLMLWHDAVANRSACGVG